jgi:AraC-like DNA-binding protein
MMNQVYAAKEATFRVGPLVNLASVVRSLGYDPVLIFNQSGFDPEEFQDPDHRLPYLETSRLLANCVEATGCEELGLLLGQQAEASHLGLAGFLMRAAPKVEQALRVLVENLDLHDEGGSATLDIGPEYTCFGFVIQLPGVSATEQIYDLSAVMLYKIMQALCGTDWVAASVKLVRREPDDWRSYQRFFRTSVFFNSTECSVTFSNQCLKHDSPYADALLYKYLKHEAMQLHELQHHELMEELPAVMRRGLLAEQFAARDIADVFGIHERTLHRRLRDAETSFRSELDKTRKSVSEQLLGSTTLPVCDIANALGYADSSGFIRAFQRWCEISPSLWRKKNSPRPQKNRV